MLLSKFELSSQSWSVNGNHQTSILLPHLPNPSVQTPVTLGCSAFRGLHGLDRSHHYISMVRRAGSLVPPFKLTDIVIPFTTPGIESIQALKVTATMLMTSLLAAAQPTSVSTFWSSYLYGPVVFRPGGRWLVTLRQPIPLLWRLRTSVKQQIVLTVLFTLAGLYVSAQDWLSDWQLTVDLVSSWSASSGWLFSPDLKRPMSRVNVLFSFVSFIHNWLNM